MTMDDDDVRRDGHNDGGDGFDGGGPPPFADGPPVHVSLNP